MSRSYCKSSAGNPRFRLISYLVLLPIDLMNRIPILLVNNLPNRLLVFGRTHFLSTHNLQSAQTHPYYPSHPALRLLKQAKGKKKKQTHTVRRILHKLVRVPKAPTADIQPLGPAASDQVLGVEGRVLGRDAQVAQHDVADVLGAMHGRSDGRAVLRRGDGWWEGERHVFFWRSWCFLSLPSLGSLFFLLLLGQHGWVGGLCGRGRLHGWDLRVVGR